MKIAYFVDEFPPFFRGGLGTYAMEITQEYVRGGHEITVFSRNSGKDATNDVWNGVKVHRPVLMNMVDVLPLISPGDVSRWDRNSQQFFIETLLYDFLSASKLINVLHAKEGQAFDVAVAHDWLAFPAGIVTRSNLPVPLVVHFHSTEQGRTGGGSQAVQDIERAGAAKADLIVTVSYAMRDELVRLGYPEGKIRVVYNGVDTKKYAPGAFGAEEIRAFREKIGVGDAPMIFFVGRLTWVKGADTLTMAMAQIVREIPDAKLVIVGSGEQQDMLRNIVQQNGLENNVVFNFKYITEDERRLHYAACDVAIFPSKYEPFGIVSLEAMAMGKPVIVGATGTSGFREQVIPFGEKICGFHINPHDPSDIAKFAILLLKDKELQRTMGVNARKRVLEAFTWEKAAQDTLHVYEEAVQVYRKRVIAECEERAKSCDLRAPE
ncbi:MAG TPA: glycosyltransferase family 4 protein [Methanocella sp.]|nr:glycosyltransferase family 4 protein [Methanocella sp.]